MKRVNEPGGTQLVSVLGRQWRLATYRLFFLQSQMVATSGPSELLAMVTDYQTLSPLLRSI